MTLTLFIAGDSTAAIKAASEKGVEDNTHFCEEGAQEIAKLVVQSIEQSTLLQLKQLLKGEII